MYGCLVGIFKSFRGSNSHDIFWNHCIHVPENYYGTELEIIAYMLLKTWPMISPHKNRTPCQIILSNHWLLMLNPKILGDQNVYQSCWQVNFVYLFILLNSQFRWCLSSQKLKSHHSAGKTKNINLNLFPGCSKICIRVMWCIFPLWFLEASVYAWFKINMSSQACTHFNTLTVYLCISSSDHHNLASCGGE